jgi:hypothetical protein
MLWLGSVSVSFPGCSMSLSWPSVSRERLSDPAAEHQLFALALGGAI